MKHTCNPLSEPLIGITLCDTLKKKTHFDSGKFYSNTNFWVTVSSCQLLERNVFTSVVTVHHEAFIEKKTCLVFYV